MTQLIYCALKLDIDLPYFPNKVNPGADSREMFYRENGGK